VPNWRLLFLRYRTLLTGFGVPGTGAITLSVSSRLRQVCPFVNSSTPTLLQFCFSGKRKRVSLLNICSLSISASRFRNWVSSGVLTCMYLVQYPCGNTLDKNCWQVDWKFSISCECCVRWHSFFGVLPASRLKDYDKASWIFWKRRGFPWGSRLLGMTIVLLVEWLNPQFMSPMDFLKLTSATSLYRFFSLSLSWFATLCLEFNYRFIACEDGWVFPNIKISYPWDALPWQQKFHSDQRIQFAWISPHTGYLWLARFIPHAETWGEFQIQKSRKDVFVFNVCESNLLLFTLTGCPAFATSLIVS
jgi:hypothetical protein